jgi:putative methionine-R-sulfoxide reductase with GAF domain
MAASLEHGSRVGHTDEFGCFRAQTRELQREGFIGERGCLASALARGLGGVAMSPRGALWSSESAGTASLRRTTTSSREVEIVESGVQLGSGETAGSDPYGLREAW